MKSKLPDGRMSIQPLLVYWKNKVRVLLLEMTVMTLAGCLTLANLTEIAIHSQVFPIVCVLAEAGGAFDHHGKQFGNRIFLPLQLLTNDDRPNRISLSRAHIRKPNIIHPNHSKAGYMIIFGFTRRIGRR